MEISRGVESCIRAGICPDQQTDGNKTDLSDVLPAGGDRKRPEVKEQSGILR
jgi:hypothetical protein